MAWRFIYKKFRIIPPSSIVGMLLEHEEQCIIIKSIQKGGFLQHDIYSWLAERNHFLYLDDVTTSSRFIDRTLKSFVSDMGVEQREQFIDSMFAIFSHTNASTLKELREDWTKNAFIYHLMLFFKKKRSPSLSRSGLLLKFFLHLNISLLICRPYPRALLLN